MADEPTTTNAAPPPESSAHATPDGTDDGYRPSRWVWFALGGLAVVVLTVGALVSNRNLLFEDDFSRSGSLGRWLEDESASGSMAYEEGTYHVGVPQQGELISIAELPGRHSSIHVEVDAWMVSGTGGLSVLCIAETGPETTDEIQAVSGQADYYDFFLFFSEGAVAIFNSSDLETPLAATQTGLLRDGENRVEVGCSGASAGTPATLTLTVNGTSMLEYADEGGSDSFAAVGLTVYGADGAAEAAFDNLEVTAL